jgi:hypothetical protein
MKDRVNRINHKKPSHRLKAIAIAMSAFTLVFGAATSVALYHYHVENVQLSKAIDNYTTQIDLLEAENTNQSKYLNKD